MSSIERITPPPNKMCIIVCPDTTHRKSIHQYIDAKYPHISKASAKTRSEYREIACRFMKCYHCGNKKDFIITCGNCAKDFHETWLEEVKS